MNKTNKLLILSMRKTFTSEMIGKYNCKSYDKISGVLYLN